MAIKIQKPTKFGDTIVAEYWRVGVANIHPRTQSCYVVLDGYINKAARDGGKSVVDSIEMSIPWTAFSNSNNPNIKDIYLHLKTLEAWATGEDV